MDDELDLPPRDAAGLAPVDLTLDASLRAGDVIATTDGLVAYSGIKVGNNQNPDFTPVASYPGLTAEVRAYVADPAVLVLDEATSAVDVQTERRRALARRAGTQHRHVTFTAVDVHGRVMFRPLPKLDCG